MPIYLDSHLCSYYLYYVKNSVNFHNVSEHDNVACVTIQSETNDSVTFSGFLCHLQLKYFKILGISYKLWLCEIWLSLERAQDILEPVGDAVSGLQGKKLSICIRVDCKIALVVFEIAMKKTLTLCFGRRPKLIL